MKDKYLKRVALYSFSGFIVLLLLVKNGLFDSRIALGVMNYLFLHEFVLMKFKDFWQFCHIFTCINFIALIAILSFKMK